MPEWWGSAMIGSWSLFGVVLLVVAGIFLWNWWRNRG